MQVEIQTITEGESVTLDGSKSEGAIEYFWNSSRDQLLGNSSTATLLPSFLSVGVHTVWLSIKGKDGNWANDDIQITVKAKSDIFSELDDLIAEIEEEPTPSGSSTIKKTGQIKSYYDKDDGYYQTGVAHSYTRDNSKETVTDHITGLEWQDDEVVSNPDKQMKWEYAEKYCSGKGNGWRLPTRKELISIINYEQDEVSINRVFHNVIDNQYLSSSIFYPKNNNYIWTVYFGEKYSYQKSGWKFANHSVRCVRIGQ